MAVIPPSDARPCSQCGRATFYGVCVYCTFARMPGKSGSPFAPPIDPVQRNPWHGRPIDEIPLTSPCYDCKRETPIAKLTIGQICDQCSNARAKKHPWYVNGETSGRAWANEYRGTWDAPFQPPPGKAPADPAFSDDVPRNPRARCLGCGLWSVSAWGAANGLCAQCNTTTAAWEAAKRAVHADADAAERYRRANAKRVNFGQRTPRAPALTQCKRCYTYHPITRVYVWRCTACVDVEFADRQLPQQCPVPPPPPKPLRTFVATVEAGPIEACLRRAKACYSKSLGFTAMQRFDRAIEDAVGAAGFTFAQAELIQKARSTIPFGYPRNDHNAIVWFDRLIAAAQKAGA